MCAYKIECNPLINLDLIKLILYLDPIKIINLVHLSKFMYPDLI